MHSMVRFTGKGAAHFADLHLTSTLPQNGFVAVELSQELPLSAVGVEVLPLDNSRKTFTSLTVFGMYGNL